MKYKVSKVDYEAGVAVFSSEVFEGESELEILLKAQEKFGSIAAWEKLPDEQPAAPQPAKAPKPAKPEA
jgi:hypothetical protein